jgi:uncharacterized FlaG/YvyC family protein
LQKLGRDWQWANERLRRWMWRELNEGEVKEQYQVTIKNRFSALQNVEDNRDINNAWDAIRDNIKISAKKCIGHLMQSVINRGLMRNC